MLPPSVIAPVATRDPAAIETIRPTYEECLRVVASTLDEAGERRA